jgi:thiamine biosynthesis lipoprotein
MLDLLTRHRPARVFMDTVVSIEVVGPSSEVAVEEAVRRAFGWFALVETVCSRFETDSEVMRLTAVVGVPVRVSAVLFEAIRFAVALARETDGAFDPTIGRLMQQRGFNRSHRTGRHVMSSSASAAASYRDIEVDETDRTITIHRPLVIDLGAVAKGLAIDLAAKELAVTENYAIDAGGDVCVRGCNAAGGPWVVAVRHPRRPAEAWCVLKLSDAAVCTSGDYARTGTGGEHHIVDPRTGRSPGELISTTVVAPTAMLADGLSTAALVMGEVQGLDLIERQGVDGLTLSGTLRGATTDGFLRRVAAPAP